MGARETALDALVACRKDGGWSNGVLKELMVRDRLDRRDAALATRLCYGVLQNRLKLDFYLQQLLTGKLKDLHPLVRDILHLGLYQLKEMDKVPDSAVVNTSVELAKVYCKKQKFAPGLVNGVLRNATRTTLQEPKTLAEKYSHPGLLIKKLKEYVGSDALEPMLKANNEAPNTLVQVNTTKISTEDLEKLLEAEGVQACRHGWMADALAISGTGNLESLASFRDGLYYVQDVAAKLAVLCAGIERGQRVLDCCAAPGGKSFAAAVCGAGEIRSCDVHAHKVGLMENGARRLGFAQLHPLQQDATVFVPQWEKAFDVVIADVPCSGLGIIRKKPDIRYKDLKEMETLPALQLQILRNQARYVRPGGVLLYSTCTLTRGENEGVLEDFLKDNREFALEKLPLPSVFPKNESGMLALIPGQYDTDGFFIGKLRRKP